MIINKGTLIKVHYEITPDYKDLNEQKLYEQQLWIEKQFLIFKDLFPQKGTFLELFNSKKQILLEFYVSSVSKSITLGISKKIDVDKFLDVYLGPVLKTLIEASENLGLFKITLESFFIFTQDSPIVMCVLNEEEKDIEAIKKLVKSKIPFNKRRYKNPPYSFQELSEEDQKNIRICLSSQKNIQRFFFERSLIAVEQFCLLGRFLDKENNSRRFLTLAKAITESRIFKCSSNAKTKILSWHKKGILQNLIEDKSINNNIKINLNNLVYFLNKVVKQHE